MTAPTVRASRDWLTLREPTDAASRSTVLVQRLAEIVSTPLVVHDLGAGTGSMRRWLAPQFPGPQVWVEHDRDRDLLMRAEPPTSSRDGRPVVVHTVMSELAALPDLEGASLVTASALLDVLTADGLGNLVDLVVSARVPCLLTLSVVGRVELHPSDPLDAEIEGAFNDHQRRLTTIGGLLGPDAVGRAVQLFNEHGWAVLQQSSPWVLTADTAELLTAWLLGWVGAASEQDRGLDLDGYLAWRMCQAREGQLRALVHHLDLLAWPP